MKIEADDRKISWAEIEEKIQKCAKNKDSNFKLSGPWKTFVREQSGLKIYAVDGKWIRNNICFIFGHGGHGYVHEFIPLDEVWVDTHHRKDCNCIVNYLNQPVSENYFNSTVIHEIEEFQHMKTGMDFWQAHHLALEKEIKIGILKDPFDDSE